MAPQPSTGAALPPTFTCRVCGKEKAPAEYSKNQLQKWYNQKRNDRYNEVTPQSAGLSCKDHGAAQRELRCHGPCDLIKVVERFSKRQRNEPNPWCIDCTEWRTSFNGDETPTVPPNRPFAGYENDSVRVNRWESPSYPLVRDEDEDEEYEEYEEDDDDDDDDDEIGNPYDDSGPISGLVDRLEGYGGLADVVEGLTTDVMSTANSVKISLWDENTNDGRSNSGSGNFIRTSSVTRPWNMQNDVPMISNPGRHASHSQGYTPAASNTAIAPLLPRVPPHSDGLARRPLGASMSHQTRNAQANTSMSLGEGNQSMPSRSTASHPASGQRNQTNMTGGAFALVNEPSRSIQPSTWKPNTKSQESRKGTGNKWYKGDNRRVFTGNSKLLPDAVYDRTEVPHDSDSPDEM
ncbi:hypothetical protein F4825DRAFT_471753 [Nemania diffusa]|nr:hypothetical protein F4825DRAFT_471753 [Nemania diffusa]